MQEINKNKLEILDDITLQAIREVFIEEIELVKPIIVGNDTELGQSYRAYETSKSILENAFKNIKSYKTGNAINKSFSKEK